MSLLDREIETPEKVDVLGAECLTRVRAVPFEHDSLDDFASQTQEKITAARQVTMFMGRELTLQGVAKVADGLEVVGLPTGDDDLLFTAGLLEHYLAHQDEVGQQAAAAEDVARVRGVELGGIVMQGDFSSSPEALTA